MLCDLPEVTDGSVFYLTAGTEYDDEAYVWVGQVQMTTSLAGGVSQLLAELQLQVL